MTFATKKRIVLAGLTLFTLWPLAQMGLVWKYEISPWKLGGWGMYATPRIAPGVGILVREKGTERSIPLKVVPPELRVEADTYQMRRLWLRKLAPPDRLGRVALASNPAFEQVTVLLVELRVDARTGMVRSEETRYEYRR